MNPYAPPESEVEALDDTNAIWRDGKLLVMHKRADLPARCILCNESTQPGKLRSVSYLNIWLQIAMLVLFLAFRGLALLPILIASLVFRKTARVRMPLCEDHRRKRLWGTAITFALLAASIALGVVAAMYSALQGPIFFIALAFFIAALALALIRGHLLRAKKIDKEIVILKGAKAPFLDSLPQYPGS